MWATPSSPVNEMFPLLDEMALETVRIPSNVETSISPVDEEVEDKETASES